MPLPGINPDGTLTERGAAGASEAIAAAGSVIANATAIGNVNLSVITGADDTKGVVRPAAYRGREIKLYNDQATNGLKVYPPVNSTLNGGAANSALVLEGKTMALCVGTGPTNWGMIFTANS